MASNAKQRLTEQDLRTIVTLLEVWEGPLTWDLLVQRVARVLGRSFTRQALNGHEAIKATYQARKRRNRMIRESLRQETPATDHVPPELALALQRAEAADLRAKSLEQIVVRYREKFVTWLYNARNAGLTESQLNAPLPPTDQSAGALWSKRKVRD